MLHRIPTFFNNLLVCFHLSFHFEGNFSFDHTIMKEEVLKHVIEMEKSGENKKIS